MLRKIVKKLHLNASYGDYSNKNEILHKMIVFYSSLHSAHALMHNEVKYKMKWLHFFDIFYIFFGISRYIFLYIFSFCNIKIMCMKCVEQLIAFYS